MPAVLERCVADVKSRLLKKAAAKRGISIAELSDKVKEKAESSAYGICTSSLKKAGKM